MVDRYRWNERYRSGAGATGLNPRLVKYHSLLKRGWLLDLAGGIGQNAAWLVEHGEGWRAVVADLSDEALANAPRTLARVQCDAAALPFKLHAFDTVLCSRFYDARVVFRDWLAPGGTVFFETYSVGDIKYRPDFNPAHRFDPADRRVFEGLEILVWEECDDGKRVFVTVVGQRQKDEG